MTLKQWNTLELCDQLRELLNNKAIVLALSVLRTEAEPTASAEATANPIVAAALHHQRAGYFKALSDLESLATASIPKKVPKVDGLARTLDDVPADFIQH